MINSKNLKTLIQIDGGVTPHNTKALQQAGANILVAGSAVFKGGADYYVDNILALR